MLLYYITDRRQLPGTESAQLRQLLKRMEQAARLGVDFIQLRERDLGGRALESLAKEAVACIRETGSHTRLLINSRTDIALSSGAQGVHLRSEDLSPAEVRTIWRRVQGERRPIVAVSCHHPQEVAQAAGCGADLVVFGPVFEKGRDREGPVTGLRGLRSACSYPIPVLALGGVTVDTAPRALAAGAQGIAAIRLFQEGEIEETLSKLRVEGQR